MSEFVSILSGIFRFFDLVAAFVKMLQKTPIEKHQALMAEVSAAFEKADAKKPDGTRSDDTSGIEDIING
jgi:hypothetical protein